MVRQYETERFIECVREYPALWEKDSWERGGRSCRNRAWLEVGKIFYTDWDDESKKIQRVIDMKTKWKNIRDTYLKACKEKKRYKNADSLQFLRNSIEKRLKSSSTKSHSDPFDFAPDAVKTQDSSNDFPAFNEDSETRQMELELSAGACYTPDHTEHTETETKKVESQPLTPFQSMLLEKLEGSEKNSEEDADRYFLLSLLPDVKKLSPREKFKFKLMNIQFFIESLT